MKFEKLNDSKLKIIFTFNDMLIHKISADDFFSNSCISQKIIQSILCNAETEIGFKTDDCKLLVEAVKYSEGGILFTITKIYECEYLDICLNFIYKFKSFDDFLSLCTYIKNMNSIDLKDCNKLFSLILYNNTYYLSISSVSFLPSFLLNILDEFADSIPYSASLEGLISEYGKVILATNAIQEGLKMI